MSCCFIVLESVQRQQSLGGGCDIQYSLPQAHILPASASKVPCVGCNCGNSEASTSRVSLEQTGMYLLARGPTSLTVEVQKAAEPHHHTTHLDVLWNKVGPVIRKQHTKRCAPKI